MKPFFAFLICLVGSVILAADINETNIPIATAGGTKTTDYVRVLTNASPNIADSKTRLLKIGDLLSLGGGGSQVWTNDGQFIFPSGTTVSNTSYFTLTTNGSVYSKHAWIDHGDIYPETQQLFPYILAMLESNELNNIGFIYSVADSANENNQSTADLTVGSGMYDFTINMSLHGYSSNNVNNARIDLQVQELGSRILLTTSNNATAVSIGSWSPMASAPISIGCGSATNGSIVVSNGYIGPSVYYPSNAAPAIPGAATLGIGGYWMGNSNGFLVTVYTLDGSTTVMKVLAP